MGSRNSARGLQECPAYKLISEMRNTTVQTHKLQWGDKRWVQNFQSHAEDTAFKMTHESWRYFTALHKTRRGLYCRTRIKQVQTRKFICSGHSKSSLGLDGIATTEWMEKISQSTRKTKCWKIMKKRAMKQICYTFKTCVSQRVKWVQDIGYLKASNRSILPESLEITTKCIGKGPLNGRTSHEQKFIVAKLRTTWSY